jgi:hypothetical protein
MKPRTMIPALLLLFVGASIAYLVIGDRFEGRKTSVDNTDGTREVLQPAPAEGSGNPSEDRVDGTPITVAYYFHRDFRCQTCLALEALCHEAVESGFPDELEDGSLEWRVVNVDEPENEHFVDRFQLYAQSLVVERYRNGEAGDWKNLEKIWDLMGNREEFTRYVQSEIRTFLEEE